MPVNPEWKALFESLRCMSLTLCTPMSRSISRTISYSPSYHVQGHILLKCVTGIQAYPATSAFPAAFIISAKSMIRDEMSPLPGGIFKEEACIPCAVTKTILIASLALSVRIVPAVPMHLPVEGHITGTQDPPTPSPSIKSCTDLSECRDAGKQVK